MEVSDALNVSHFASVFTAQDAAWASEPVWKLLKYLMLLPSLQSQIHHKAQCKVPVPTAPKSAQPSILSILVHYPFILAGVIYRLILFTHL
jgi:hypothetical protein